MPLMPGSSPKTMSQNIEELMNSFKNKGSIGTSVPKTKSKAQKQAIAIAYREAGKK